MGLAVSYGIIQEHGGTIDVTSAPGEGTTFTLTFPSVAQPDHPDQAPPTTAVTRHARILVVDDEDAVRTVLDRLLTLRGHTIRQAASGPEALRLARSEPFDIVFTDQAMPDMSGRQFAHALRQQYPHLPIVLLTGDTDQGTVDDDIDAVLSKPFKVDDLEAVIQSLI
ncbi:MAG: hybrid sensor histidine kinase/response regulator [Bacteroidetes bacterium]|nr:MAG: hybrid sensor histidine kinase/response regulator [Bacteroidota bacterium]